MNDSDLGTALGCLTGCTVAAAVYATMWLGWKIHKYGIVEVLK